jgi:hypothetical protein
LGKAFFAPGSHASLLSLVGAFLIAFAFLMFRRYRKGRRIRVRALLRALFPRHIVGSKSTLADLGYFYFNIFLFGLVFGWALLSYEVVRPFRRAGADGGFRAAAADSAAGLCLSRRDHDLAVSGL